MTSMHPRLIGRRVRRCLLVVALLSAAPAASFAGPIEQPQPLPPTPTPLPPIPLPPTPFPSIPLPAIPQLIDEINQRVREASGTELTPRAPLPPAPAPLSPARPGRAPDLSTWFGRSPFASLAIAGMSPDAVSSMLSARERQKAELFADAIGRLEREASLADVPDCKDTQQVETGDCLVTDSLKREFAAGPGNNALLIDPSSPSATPPPASPAVAALSNRPEATAGAGGNDDNASAGHKEGADDATFGIKRRVKSAALPQIKRKVAVLIGIDDYADTRIPKLGNAANDARALGELLDSRLGYETVVLPNASKQQIVRTLNRLALTLGAKDSVVVYYAGHGQLVSATGLGYWQPADADATRPETWLSNADVGKLVARLGASQVALVSDSCFAGSLVSAERIRPAAGGTDAAALLKRRAAVVMTSGGNEPVFDDGKDGHSLFAHGLMQALRQVSAWQAGGNVFERVRFAVSKELPQRPRYGAALTGGHEAGADYLFERRELE